MKKCAIFLIEPLSTFNVTLTRKTLTKRKTQTSKPGALSSHIPSRVSVCSNGPGYQQPKCFVREGNSDELMRKFVEYLVAISAKSSSLLHQQYATVFEALNQASVPGRGKTHENQLAQMLVRYARRK